MPSSQALSNLLLTLYACPTSPELWLQFLKEFVAFLEIPAVALMNQDTKNERGRINCAFGLDPEGMRRYTEHYGKVDVYRAGAMSQPVSHVIFADEICPVSQLKETEFYNDFLVKDGIVLACGILTSKTPTGYENVSLYRDVNDDSLPDAFEDRLQLVLPHLKSALRTRRQLVDAQATANDLADSLNTIQHGLILLDETGSCFYMNRAAEKTVAEKDGLRCRGPRLCAELPSESAKLEALIQRSTGQPQGKSVSEGGALSISPRFRRPLQIWVSSFLPRNLNVPRRAVAIVLISDPDLVPVPSAEILRALYDLTPAESRLAVALARGKELKEACDECSITYTAGRAHLRSIFTKAGVRRQAELVSLLLRTDLPFRDDLATLR